MKQQQFLNVIHRDEAEQRFQAALPLEPLGRETVDLECAWGRVLAEDVVAAVDVPSFDRSNYDGFAIRAADTFGASEEEPRRLKLLDEAIGTAHVPQQSVQAGTAMAIATGGMVPRGADAVLMVEHADTADDQLLVHKAVTAGFGVSFAGTDITQDETVLRRGERLSSRETGVLAAIGRTSVDVWRQPRVAILSTGNEIIAPGQPMQPGLIYDSNARVLADAVREQGGIPEVLGIVADDVDQLRTRLRHALQVCDVVLLSGGTSKGAGDMSYRVVAELKDPGIVAHGVALKPGKPICLAVSGRKPVAVLPGFPTSAIFTFHEFIAPVLRRLGGLSPEARSSVPARLAVRVNSEIGRTEYLLVGLVAADVAADESPPQHVAWPMGKGSGSVTTFSRADGFITIDRHREMLEAGTLVDVQLLGRDLPLADLVVMGSHCVGLDSLLGQLQDQGFHTKFMAVGSTAGLQAARLGQCDVAGIHLYDPASNSYNRPFIDESLELLTGYRRLQGVVFRQGDGRFEGRQAEQAFREAAADAQCLMINRNAGSGTRLLIDWYLEGMRPAGYAVQARNHHAVAAAVLQHRADWGVCIQEVADQPGLGFLPLCEESFDFVVPRRRLDRPAVQAFRRLVGATPPLLEE